MNVLITRNCPAPSHRPWRARPALRPAPFAALFAVLLVGTAVPAAAIRAEVTFAVDGFSRTYRETSPLNVQVQPELITFGPTGANVATASAAAFLNPFTDPGSISSTFTATHTLRTAAEVSTTEVGNGAVGASVAILQPYKLVADPGVDPNDPVTLRLEVTADGTLQSPLDGSGNPLGLAEVGGKWSLAFGDRRSSLLTAGDWSQDNSGSGEGSLGFDFMSTVVDGTRISRYLGNSVVDTVVSLDSIVFLSAELFGRTDNSGQLGVFNSLNDDSLTITLTSVTPGVQLMLQAIPEPSTAVLTILGVITLGLTARWRRSVPAPRTAPFRGRDHLRRNGAREK